MPVRHDAANGPDSYIVSLFYSSLGSFFSVSGILLHTSLANTPSIDSRTKFHSSLDTTLPPSINYNSF
jgi:hypothetical protein